MSQTVLVADDSQTIRKIIAMALKAEPFNVIAVGDVKGLMREAKLHPDIILLDYYMPDVNGYDACLALKTNQHTRDIPIVMMGGTYKDFDETRAIQCGANEILMKPFTTDALFHAIGAALQAKPADIMAEQPAGPVANTIPPVPPRPESQSIGVESQSVTKTATAYSDAPVVSSPSINNSAPAELSMELDESQIEHVSDVDQATLSNSELGEQTNATNTLSDYEDISEKAAYPSAPIVANIHSASASQVSSESNAGTSSQISLKSMSEDELKDFIREEVKNTVREQLPALLRNVMGEVFQQKVLPKLLQHGEERLDSLFRDEMENKVNQRVRTELERLLGVE